MGGRREWRITQGGRTGTNRAIDKKLKEKEPPVTVIQTGKKKVVKKAPETKPVVTYADDGKPEMNFRYKKKTEMKKMSPEERRDYEETRIQAEKEFEDATMKYIFGN